MPPRSHTTLPLVHPIVPELRGVSLDEEGRHIFRRMLAPPGRPSCSAL
jgi:hypothetical protein